MTYTRPKYIPTFPIEYNLKCCAAAQNLQSFSMTVIRFAREAQIYKWTRQILLAIREKHVLCCVFKASILVNRNTSNSIRYLTKASHRLILTICFVLLRHLASRSMIQEKLFEDIGGRIIDGCVEGYNGTIFAYGQTGSGKTHTMLGPSHINNSILDSYHCGLIPRACEALFAKLCSKAAEKGGHFTYEVSCRFVELYNEEFYDLLSESQQKLSIRSDSKGVELLGVSKHRVQSSLDMIRVGSKIQIFSRNSYENFRLSLFKILGIGWEIRRTAETAMNRESSRSHAIFIVDVKTEELINTIVNKKCATLNLVDLAGSERQTRAGTVGDRFKEAVNINLSLTVLDRVIRTLSDANRRCEHVPYRDSKLTHILRDSLGGNSRTVVIVNIHPDKEYYSDTLSSLQFAAACRGILNRVHANEDLTGDTVIAYKCEIARLRQEICQVEEKVRSDVASRISAIEEEKQSWKELAISREKAFVKLQIQCDLLSAQLNNKVNEGNKEARSELVQLQERYDRTESARKILNEKYDNILKECDGTFPVTPLRSLNLTTGIKNDRDMIQERELLRLEIDNNRMSQIILEKEAAIKNIYEKQRNQSKLWIEEKNAYIEKIESLEADKCSLSKTANEMKQQLQLLSTKLSSSNDQESSINELRHELDVALEDNRNLKVLNNDIEKKHHNQLMTLQLKADEINQILSSCRKVEEEKEELTLRYEDLERNYQHLRERHELTKVVVEEDLKQFKRRHMDDLSSIIRSLDMVQKAHDKTKQQYLTALNTFQEKCHRILAELQANRE
ncbi:kinesin motor domain protein [Dictyocaulus viviparus]|uniref:Kinesin-like protein n=1 Tax=Dictyocaulus viviparus TaxID=29172 RepID=A0A0D8XA32_DICVI|nr:kinesin motor domain protein [Dictyocaulus viviparus]